MTTIKLNEGQLKTILKMNITPNGIHQTQYSIHPDKVLIVKKYLDKNFLRGESEDVGEDGFPHTTACFGMKDGKGVTVKNLFQEDMLDLLLHQFPHICQNEDENKKFLGKVMEDWYNNKIGLYGSLSVNHL